jgi:serine/threonine protein kinase
MASTQRLTFDEVLVRRLPLPLAQLYRRAHNAKTPLERHLTAFYLWEAAIKLLSSVAVVEYAHLGEPVPAITERLENLARPSLGHWWEFVRLIVPFLADRGREPFRSVRELLLGRSRDDLPRAAGLDAALRQVLEGKEGARASVRLQELIDRLVRYRNTMLGHGAPGRRKDDFNERLGSALLAAAAEVLGRLDVLAGRRLIHVGEVRQVGGVWVVMRYELLGENARQIASLELPREEASRLPDGDRVHLSDPMPTAPSEAECDSSGPTKPDGTVREDEPVGLLPLHPLLVYDNEAGEVLFLNARRGRRRTEYLGYTTGRTAERTDLVGEQAALLAKVLAMEVGAAQVADWAARSQAEEPTVPEEAPARRLIGEYELLSELGRGGMGVVYRAWQPSLGRQVALKKLLSAGDEKAEARFRREIRALGRVEHPNLVKVFTSGSDGDQWFYTMELIDGVPLSAVGEWLQLRGGAKTAIDPQTWQQAISSAYHESRRTEKPLTDLAGEPEMPASPTRTASGNYVRYMVELIRQAAQAAHALHEAGVIHRDIKPGNILMTADGTQAVLMDLGLAQLADETEGRLTRTRQFVGTLRYASPQQVLAVGPLDRRADVYSLGATLWEMLALAPLYGATEQTPTPVLMEQVQRQEPARLRSVNPAVSRDLEAVVHKCLEKDATRRYATAAELADDLGRYLAGEPVRARRVGRWERGWKWARRHPAPAALIGVSMLAVLTLLVGGAWFTWRLDQAWRAAERAATEARENEATAKVAQARAEETLADGLLRPLGNVPGSQPLNEYELAALWDLTSLPKENDRVRILFLDRALRDVRTAEQLERRMAYAMHAAVGLDPRRRRQAQDILLRHLQETGTDWRVRRSCALAAVALRSDVAPLAREAASAVVEAMGRTTEPAILSRLGKALAELPPRDDKENSAHAIDLLLKALARAKETPDRVTLGEALAALAASMEPDQARAAVGHILTTIAENTMEGDAARPQVLPGLAGVLATLTPRLGGREGAEDIGKAVDHFLKGMSAHPSNPAALSRALVALTPSLESRQAEEVYGTAAGHLLKAIATTEDASAVAVLEETLAAVSAQLSPRKCREAAGGLLETMAKERDASVLARQGKAMALLTKPLAVKEAEEVGETAAALVLEATATTDLPALAALGKTMAALAPRLSAPQAGKAADRLLRIMSTTSNPLTLAGLGEAVAALAPEAGERPAEAAADHLIEAIRTNFDESGLGPLAQALAALAPRLGSGQAEKAANLVLKTMTMADPTTLAPLAEAVAALAVRLKPDQSREICSNAAGLVLKTMTMTEPALIARLAEAMAALAPRLERQEAQASYSKAAGILLQTVATTKENVDPARRGLVALAARLERDSLIEVLQQPTCIGSAREIVLRRLSEVMGRRFATVWDVTG